MAEVFFWRESSQITVVLHSGKYGTAPSSDATNEGIQEKNCEAASLSGVAQVHKNDVQEVMKSHTENC